VEVEADRQHQLQRVEPEAVPVVTLEELREPVQVLVEWAHHQVHLPEMQAQVISREGVVVELRTTHIWQQQVVTVVSQLPSPVLPIHFLALLRALFAVRATAPR
jgi:hypothetical protein